jgi:hypothetical protein
VGVGASVTAARLVNEAERATCANRRDDKRPWLAVLDVPTMFH